MLYHKTTCFLTFLIVIAFSLDYWQFFFLEISFIMAVGIIGFDHYKISCIIGVNEEERAIFQDIFIDLRIEHDFSEAAREDQFEKTICYEKLGILCEELVTKRKYRLLETFAFELIELLTKEMKIKWAFVRIKKTSALKPANWALVELEGGKRSWV